MAGTPKLTLDALMGPGGKEEEEEAGGIKGIYQRFMKRATVQRVVSKVGTLFTKAKDWTWVIGSTAVVVVLPIMLEMEREATFQLQAEMMQKNIMEMTKQAQQQGPQLPQ